MVVSRQVVPLRPIPSSGKPVLASPGCPRSVCRGPGRAGRGKERRSAIRIKLIAATIAGALALAMLGAAVATASSGAPGQGRGA